MILYQWRVIEAPEPDVWRHKGKVLGWRMAEEDAAKHEQATGRKLEKVPGSAEETVDYGLTSDPQTNRRGQWKPLTGG